MDHVLRETFHQHQSGEFTRNLPPLNDLPMSPTNFSPLFPVKLKKKKKKKINLIYLFIYIFLIHFVVYWAIISIMFLHLVKEFNTSCRIFKGCCYVKGFVTHFSDPVSCAEEYLRRNHIKKIKGVASFISAFHILSYTSPSCVWKISFKQSSAYGFI